MSEPLGSPPPNFTGLFVSPSSRSGSTLGVSLLWAQVVNWFPLRGERGARLLQRGSCALTCPEQGSGATPRTAGLPSGGPHPPNPQPAWPPPAPGQPLALCHLLSSLTVLEISGHLAF